MEIDVLVKLAAADPWSFTVLETLIRRFGLEQVTAVERLKVWTLYFDIDNRDNAVRITEGLMQETALLANPNRDIWYLRSELDDASLQGLWDRSGGADALVIKVTDREDIVGSAMTGVVRSRLGITEISCIRSSVVWIVVISKGERSPDEIAREIAVARSWRKGLLSNPHFQTAEIFGAEEYLLAKRGER